MPIPLADLAQRVGAQLQGDGSVPIARVATLEAAGPDAIAFLTNPRYRGKLQSTRAGAVIVSPASANDTALPKLVSANPYAVYAKVAILLHPREAAPAGVHPSAVIGQGARIASSASIAALCVIGEGAVIGERVTIGPACAIGAGAAIGEDSLLHANVTIYHQCTLGRRAIVHSGAVIGADGFGMAEENGRWIKIPQTGRVVIGDDVEIGANTTIDRGAIEDTVVEDDVKLDNQIQIGHNCRIGAHTAIAGCAGIAGSTRIGRNCKIGGAALIGGHLTIADDVTISGATQVFDSIDVPGMYTGVIAPLPHREWRRWASALRRLTTFEGRLRALEGTARKEQPDTRPDGEP